MSFKDLRTVLRVALVTLYEGENDSTDCKSKSFYAKSTGGPKRLSDNKLPFRLDISECVFVCGGMF